MSGLHLGNLATGTGWGGNNGDYALILIGTLATFAVSWFSMTGWGYESFQERASNALHFSRIRDVIKWIHKERTDKALEFKAAMSYVFGSVWLRYIFGLPPGFADEKTPEEKKVWRLAERRYAMAMEYSSYIEAGFSYLIGAEMWVMIFFTWWTALYDNATAIGPGTTVAGWYIALIVLVCITLLFHKTAAILCFANWFPPRVAGYILEVLAIFTTLGVLICSAVLATTEAWGFLGTAIVAFLLMIALFFYFIWLLIHARIVVYLWHYVIDIEAHMNKTPRG